MAFRCGRSCSKLPVHLHHCTSSCNLHAFQLVLQLLCRWRWAVCSSAPSLTVEEMKPAGGAGVMECVLSGSPPPPDQCWSWRIKTFSCIFLMETLWLPPLTPISRLPHQPVASQLCSSSLSGFHQTDNWSVIRLINQSEDTVQRNEELLSHLAWNVPLVTFMEPGTRKAVPILRWNKSICRFVSWWAAPNRRSKSSTRNSSQTLQ